MKNPHKAPYSLFESNELIEGSYKLPLFEMKLLNLAISKIEWGVAQPIEGYTITVKEFMKAYDCDASNAHHYMKNAGKNILSNPIRLYQYELAGIKRDFVDIAWCTIFSYTSSKTFADEGCITLKFSPEIEPCLFELQKRFTELDFQDLASLNTPFSVKLYSWLVSKKWKGHTINLSIEWIKERGGIQGKYEDYRSFRTKLIEPAINKINEKTSNFFVEFTPVKEGKTIVSIDFILTPKQSVKGKIKPIRPRLPRRPKVAKGSHEEGVWARKGIEILTSYQAALAEFNKNAKLDLPDVQRLVNYFDIIGDKDNQFFWQDVLNSRSRKN